MEIEELSKKIDKYQEENIKRADKNKFMNLSYILYGFALGASGFAAARPNLLIALIAIVFLIGGFVSLWYSTRIKVK